MKNIYLIIVLLFSNLISAQELVEDLEKSANSVLDLDKTKKNKKNCKAAYFHSSCKKRRYW